MEKNTNYRAWGSVGHYVQGPGVLDEIVDYANDFGKHHFYLIDVFFYREWKIKLEKLYENNSSMYSSAIFEGEITHTKIQAFEKEVFAGKADTVIAIGGGKSIDVAKVIAAHKNCALIICPTIASTDAPTSAMSILYSETGKMEEIMLHKENPDLVLVDSKIISKAPVRFLVAGMGDALATYFEGQSNQKTCHANYIWCDKRQFQSTISGQAIAEKCYNILLRDGRRAKQACEHQLLIPALENIIECNILMSGLGFENVGCSVAHAIGNAITVLPEGEQMMHGERVAFGVLCQLLAEQYPPEIIENVTIFCKDIGLPVNFRELQIEMTEEKLHRIAIESMKAESWQACSEVYMEDDIVNLMRMVNIMNL